MKKRQKDRPNSGDYDNRQFFECSANVLSGLLQKLAEQDSAPVKFKGEFDIYVPEGVGEYLYAVELKGNLCINRFQVDGSKISYTVSLDNLSGGSSTIRFETRREWKLCREEQQ